VYSQNLANFLGFFTPPQKKKPPFYGVNHIFKVAKNVRIRQIKNFVESPISSTKTILWLLAC
jgi:hypothetical protein